MTPKMLEEFTVQTATTVSSCFNERENKVHVYEHFIKYFKIICQCHDFLQAVLVTQISDLFQIIQLPLLVSILRSLQHQACSLQC